MKTKILSLFLAVVMLFSILSVGATAESLTDVPEGYTGIYTKDDLFAVRENPSGKYILMNDIVFDDADYVNGGDFYNSGKGWEPIGTSSTPFKGTFDGNGYSIVNLQINNPDGDYQGLFGYAYKATIRQVTIVNSCIVGKQNIGGIVGYIYSSYVKNCCNTSSVTGKSYVGGIVGFSSVNKSSSGENSYISECINTGNITATGSYVGGILGNGEYNYSKTNVQESINTGTIRGSEYVGGICGYVYKISHCYSIGTIYYTKKYYVDPIAGFYASQPIFNYYLDTANPNFDSVNGEKSSDQLRKQGTFEQWDFDTVWTMEGREDFPYPELRNVPLVFPDDSKTEISGTVTVKGEAKVGSTLTAEITDVTPADATFEYEWKVDGKIVSTDATYTVTQDDVGKNITLTVKGNGDFKGDFSSSAIIGECVHSVAEYTDNNDATCDKNETKSGVCEKCNATVIEEIEDSMLPHTFINYIYDNNATCTADGTKTAKCENCNATDTITAENTMVEHDFSDGWTIDKEATCTEEGIKSHHCKDCTATKDETVLNKLAHIYIADINEATCCEDGEIIYTCSCGDTYSTIIYATGHIDNDGDEYCDECLESLRNVCPCVCHSEDSLISFFQRIIRFLRSLFGLNFCRQCKCPYV